MASTYFSCQAKLYGYKRLAMIAEMVGVTRILDVLENVFEAVASMTQTETMAVLE